MTDCDRAKRLGVILVNALGIYAEAHSDYYNSSEDFWEFLFGELGTDEKELELLGVDLSETL